MSRRSLAAALDNQPDAPCAACPFASKCAVELLACADFWNYVNTPIGRTPRLVGKPRTPNRYWYNFTYHDPKPGVPNRERRIPKQTLDLIGASEGPLAAVALLHSVSISTVHRLRKLLRQEALSSEAPL